MTPEPQDARDPEPDGFIDAAASPDTDAAGRLAVLMRENVNVRGLVGVMLGLRQIYQLAYADLESVVAAAYPEAVATVMGTISEAVASGSDRPVDVRPLLVGFRDTIAPWLLDAVRRRVAAERDVAEQERVETPVSIGFDVLQAGGVSPGFDRRKSVVLVGPRPAVIYAIDACLQGWIAARDPKSSAIRFSASRRPAPGLEDAHYYARVAEDAWRGAARSVRALVATLAEHAAGRISGAVDLLAVDDLGLSLDGLTVRRVPYVAADAERVLRQFGDKAGFGVLAGVFLDEDADPQVLDVKSPLWERLRVHAVVRPVSYAQEGDGFRVTVGDGVRSWLVDGSRFDLGLARPKILGVS